MKGYIERETVEAPTQKTPPPGSWWMFGLESLRVRRRHLFALVPFFSSSLLPRSPNKVDGPRVAQKLLVVSRLRWTLRPSEAFFSTSTTPHRINYASLSLLSFPLQIMHTETSGRPFDDGHYYYSSPRIHTYIHTYTELVAWWKVITPLLSCRERADRVHLGVR